jgi:hypothetical protein
MMVAADRLATRGGPFGTRHSNLQGIVDTLQGELRSTAVYHRGVESDLNGEALHRYLTHEEKLALDSSSHIAKAAEDQDQAAPSLYKYDQDRISHADEKAWRKSLKGEHQLAKLTSDLGKSGLSFRNVERVINKSTGSQRRSLDKANNSVGRYDQSHFPHVPQDDVGTRTVFLLGFRGALGLYLLKKPNPPIALKCTGHVGWKRSD